MALRCHNAFANRYATLDLNLCVSGAVLTYDSRHLTRTQIQAMYPPVGAVSLGTSRHLQVALSLNMLISCMALLACASSFKGIAGDMNVGFKQISSGFVL